MTHEEAFLIDILENPEDDTPRRIFADWLLDQPDPVQEARGEFIHLQCELARRPPNVPRLDSHARRERELIEQHGREWGAEFQRLGCTCWVFRRGFVEGIGLPAVSFLNSAASLLRQAPLKELKIYSAAGLLGDLFGSPWLARIQSLDLEHNDLGDSDMDDLPGGPPPTLLQTLFLWGNRIGDAGIASLVAADWPALARLDLAGNRIGDAGVAALAGSTLLGRLQTLGLTNNHITDAGASLLAASTFAATLGWLDVTKNPIGTTGQTALRERFGNRVHIWG